MTSKVFIALSLALFPVSSPFAASSASKVDLAFNHPLDLVVIAHVKYVSTRAYLPFCADGYLGGGHQPKATWKSLPVLELAHGSKVEDTVKRGLGGICNYVLESVSVQIAPRGRKICAYRDYNDCVAAYHMRILPEQLVGEYSLECSSEAVPRQNYENLRCTVDRHEDEVSCSTGLTGKN